MKEDLGNIQRFLTDFYTSQQCRKQAQEMPDKVAKTYAVSKEFLHELLKDHDWEHQKFVSILHRKRIKQVQAILSRTHRAVPASQFEKIFTHYAGEVPLSYSASFERDCVKFIQFLKRIPKDKRDFPVQWPSMMEFEFQQKFPRHGSLIRRKVLMPIKRRVYEQFLLENGEEK